MASCPACGLSKAGRNKYQKYVLYIGAIGYSKLADREPAAFHSAAFRSRTDRATEKAAAMGRVEDPCSGRTPAARADRKIRAEEREAQRCTVGTAAIGARGQRRGSRSGE